MIVTVTANPSIDRTITLAGALEPGAVHRAASTADDVPAGKGVNVTRTLLVADVPSRAIVVADASDPFVAALDALGVPRTLVSSTAASTQPVRCNIAITSPDGTTTKINESGATLDLAAQDALVDAVSGAAADASWVVIAGSLPGGTDASLVARLVEAARSHHGVRIAVDTSGMPLAMAVAAGGIDLIKPNEHELAELLGLAPAALDEPADAIRAARRLVGDGVRAVLLTLGGAGAALVTEDGAWRAMPPPTIVRSTVGAGDASLAGYLVAAERGALPADRLRQAVAHGSAAASLPGTTIPTLTQADAEAVVATKLSEEDA